MSAPHIDKTVPWITRFRHLFSCRYCRTFDLHVEPLDVNNAIFNIDQPELVQQGTWWYVTRAVR